MIDFFISYNGADVSWAEWVAWQLEAAGYTTLLQAWDFRPSSNFVLEMDQSSREANATIAILSQSYLGSRYCRAEWAAAFAQDPAGEKGSLIPVLVGQCDISGLLSQVVYIDLCDLDQDQARDKLLSGVQPGRAKPQTIPDFPRTRQRATPDTPCRFPGQLPTIWNTPHLRNSRFTGRTKLIEDIRSGLTSEKGQSTVQAVVGLGGGGKTQIITEYVYRYSPHYDLVWWLRAEDQETLYTDYAALASEIGIDCDCGKHRTEPMRRWLEQNRGWLLVFDNASDLDAILPYVPRNRAGHILITSRNPDWTDVARTHRVQAFERAESVEFMCRQAGITDYELAARLAELLGDLPLALAQAGSYIATTRSSIAHYIELLTSGTLDLLCRGRPFTGYQDTVITTCKLSFEKIWNESTTAASLLILCAFLGSSQIPLRELLLSAVHLPPSLQAIARDELELNDALVLLSRYSMLELDHNGVTMHGLVQAITRAAAVPEDAKSVWIDGAVSLIAEAFPWEQDITDEWPKCNSLLPHALAVIGRMRATTRGTPALGYLMRNVGLYLVGQGEILTAKALLHDAVDASKQVYGAAHEQVAGALNDYGVALQESGNLVDAVAVYNRSLDMHAAVYGPNHPALAPAMSNLGTALQALGKLDEAKTALERALQANRMIYGTDSSQTAKAENNLAVVLHELGELESARDLLEHALKVNEIVYTSNHPETAATIGNLGLVYGALGDTQGAKAAHEQALAVKESVYGPNHPDIALCLNNLAETVTELGQPAIAKPLLDRALLISESTLGKTHPMVATSLNHLAMVLHQTGDTETALSAIERAVGINVDAFGPEHPSIAINLNNMGTIMREIGDLQHSKEAYERALTIDEQAYGSDHVNVGRTVNNLGVTLEALGELKAALKAFERSLGILRSVLPVEHPWVLSTQASLSIVQGRLHHRQTPPKHDTNGINVGRNDPCPCGSGKKYKRCCYGTDCES